MTLGELTVGDGALRPERIELSGEYDIARKAELEKLFARIDGSCPVVLDVQEVTYGDSTFLSELGRLKARHPGCPITIYGASTMMLKLLTLVGFDRLFTLEEAT